MHYTCYSYPQLLRNSIDSYKQGATIHSFQLECTWEGDGHPKRLQHSVGFEGVKPVNSCIIISIHPNSYVEHQGIRVISESMKYVYYIAIRCTINILLYIPLSISYSMHGLFEYALGRDDMMVLVKFDFGLRSINCTKCSNTVP